MTINEIIPGAMLEYSKEPVKYICQHWRIEDRKWGHSNVLGNGNPSSVIRVIDIEEHLGEKCVLYECNNYKWIVPISELIRVGVITNIETEILIFN